MQKNEEIKKSLLEVYSALQRHGYNPVSQITAYLISEDPTYITAKEQARFKIQRIGRDDILEEIVRWHIHCLLGQKADALENEKNGEQT